MRVVITPAGSALRWTDDDALWLARAVEQEGAPEALVAQTLVNRWAFLHDVQPGAYPTLTSLVRDYAQPVNPEWFPNGPKFLAWLAAHPELSPEQVARERGHAAEREYTHSRRTEFSPVTYQAVNTALLGPLSIPADATHFGPPGNDHLRPLIVTPRGNTIYAGSGSPRRRYSVARHGPSFMPARMLEHGSALHAFVFTGFAAGTLLALQYRRPSRRRV